jgi:hypothetical protein
MGLLLSKLKITSLVFQSGQLNLIEELFLRGKIEAIICDDTTTMDWLISEIRLIEVGRIVQKSKLNPTQIILNLF